jgi:multidrug efflux pump subunit AcrA (membrane-fusion protein)
MKRAAAVIAVVVVLVVGSVAAFARLRHGSAAGALPTASVVRTSFVDYLQLRGEIRPAHSTILAAPMSGGSDLQIIQLARNGAAVKAGDVVVQFDTTLQQRTLEQKQSELKQAASEIDKALAEQRRRAGALCGDTGAPRSRGRGSPAARRGGTLQAQGR